MREYEQEKNLQVARDLAGLGFEATEDDYRLPACLSLDLFNGKLNGAWKAVNGTGNSISAGFGQCHTKEILLDACVLSKYLVTMFACFHQNSEGYISSA